MYGKEIQELRKEIQELKREIEWLKEETSFLLDKYFEQNPPEDEE